MKKIATAAAVILAGGAIYLGAPPSELNSVSGIQLAQEAYHAKTGKYLQVLPGNKLPQHERGTVKEKLGKDVAPNIWVHEYKGPKGDGYQVFIDDGVTLTSTGFGPEWEHRTYTRPSTLAPWVASSTVSRILKPIVHWLTPIAYAAVEVTNSHSTATVDASNQYWSIADASQTGLDFSTAFTACAYIYNTRASNLSNQNWFSKGAASNYSYNIGFADNTPYNYQSYLSANGTTLDNVKTLAQSLSQSTWYEMCAAYNGAVPNIEVWIDGSSVGTWAVGVSSLYNGTAPFEIAGQFGDGLWDGNIDNVRVYNIVLASSTVSSNYSSPCNVSTTGLVSQWFFNNDGTDSVGSNDLTNNNSATFTTDVPYACAAASATPPELIMFE